MRTAARSRRSRPCATAAATLVAVLTAAVVAAPGALAGPPPGAAATPGTAADPVTTAGTTGGAIVAASSAGTDDATASAVADAAPEEAAAEAAAAAAALDARLAQAQRALEERSAVAAAALEAYQDAVRARDEAVVAHDREIARLAETRAEEERSGEDVARWTSQAYRHGVAGGDVAELVAVVEAGDPQDLQLRLAGLRQVGRAESRDLLDAREARDAAQEATLETAGTATAADAAAVEAEAAREVADAEVAALREQVAVLDGLRAGAGLVPGVPPAVDGDHDLLPGCARVDLSAYANGRIPPAALCALPGAPGEVLRADAATAFAAMSASYAASHGGRGLCVTDAYRDLASQVAVRASRPGFAAVPGRSKHGWGVAVDLCGGVADTSSEASAWMRANAGLHGWFHPAWARAGGRLPEPWHWEFAG